MVLILDVQPHDLTPLLESGSKSDPALGFSIFVLHPQ